MNFAYLAGFSLAINGVLELYFPGWNGVFLEPDILTAETKRLIRTMYVIGAGICFSLGYIASKVK